MTITTYRKAWIKYKQSEDYKKSSAVLKNAGIKQPYRDNILQCSFAHGWTSANGKAKLIKL